MGKSKTEIYNCVWCNKPFERAIRTRNGEGRAIGVRGVGFKTCSRLCSKYYTRKSQGCNLALLKILSKETARNVFDVMKQKEGVKWI